MALRKYKPVTAGTRWRIGNAYAEITTSEPEKSLLEKQKSTAGRNAQRDSARLKKSRLRGSQWTGGGDGHSAPDSDTR